MLRRVKGQMELPDLGIPTGIWIGQLTVSEIHFS